MPLPFPKMSELVSTTPGMGGLTQQQIELLQENLQRFMSQNLSNLVASNVAALPPPATATAVPAPSPEPVLQAPPAVPLPAPAISPMVPVSLLSCYIHFKCP